MTAGHSSRGLRWLRSGFVFCVVATAPFACKQASRPTGDASAATEARDAEDPAVAEAREAARLRDEALASARAKLDAGTYDGPMIGAMSMHTSVLSEPAWPADETPDGGTPLPAGFHTIRIGYLRHGAKVPVLPDPIINSDCLEGWYELVDGGFVCGRYATLDLKNPRVRLAPRPPKLDEPLPYLYGYNLTNGTPLYRRVLSLDDRKKYEPWLAPRPAPVDPAVATNGEAQEATAADDLDAGVAPASVREASGTATSATIADAAATPWYMREYDGGRPQITLDETRGRGVLVRRMVRGFYLGLDRDFKAAHAHWWRTTAGFAVPFERIVVQRPLTDFHGLWIDVGAPAAADGGAPIDASDAIDGGDASDASDATAPREAAPIDAGASIVFPPGTPAFAMSSYAHKYTVDVDKKRIGWSGELPRRTGVALTGVTFTQGGATYAETAQGYWVRPSELMVAKPSAPPAELAPGEKWIDVDLTRQLLVAFEGARPVYATLVSSGKKNDVDKDKDRRTPTGTFRIREKHVSATMDGDVAADGPYSIEDVPWVMYFQGSYALHGAFWHGNFGHMMSHGCVNLSPADARALFFWTEPRLPTGWHGIFASDRRPGTIVVIHE